MRWPWHQRLRLSESINICACYPLVHPPSVWEHHRLRSNERKWRMGKNTHMYVMSNPWSYDLLHTGLACAYICTKRHLRHLKNSEIWLLCRDSSTIYPTFDESRNGDIRPYNDSAIALSHPWWIRKRRYPAIRGFSHCAVPSLINPEMEISCHTGILPLRCPTFD